MADTVAKATSLLPPTETDYHFVITERYLRESESEGGVKESKDMPQSESDGEQLCSVN